MLSADADAVNGQREHQQQPSDQSLQQPLPMHKKAIPKNPLLARQQRKGGAGTLSSPTDNMMSPCSQKIQASRKHLAGSIKPKTLSSLLNDAKKHQQPPPSSPNGDVSLAPRSSSEMLRGSAGQNGATPADF